MWVVLVLIFFLGGFVFIVDMLRFFVRVNRYKNLLDLWLKEFCVDRFYVVRSCF